MSDKLMPAVETAKLAAILAGVTVILAIVAALMVANGQLYWGRTLCLFIFGWNAYAAVSFGRQAWHGRQARS